jgi:hypothetical protein
MAITLLGNPLRPWLRNARSEAGVGAAAIVMRDPLVKKSAKMLFIA